MGFCFILSFLAAGSSGDKYTMFTAAAGKKYYCGRVGKRVLCYTIPHMAKRRYKSGQTAVEYIIVFVALLGVVAALACFVRAARSSAARTTTLVTCEYP